MNSFLYMPKRYISLRLGDFSTTLIALLLIVVGLGLWDTAPDWFDWTISSASSTAIFTCLVLVGLFLERRLSPCQLTIILWGGLGVITLLLLWSLVDSWNHLFLQPDSRSYIRNDSYRAPLYPWFIDLLTFGHDLRAPGSFYHGPIGQLITDGEDSPLIWPVRVQKVILYAAFLTVLRVLSRWTGPFMSVVLGFVICFGDFLSEENNQLLTEPLTQALTLFCLAAYCQFVWGKQLKYLLMLGICFGLAFLIRPAAGYLILLPLVAGLQYFYWHRLRLVTVFRPLFFCLALPIMLSAAIQTGYQYAERGVWAPSPVWGEKKISWALQLAGVDDIDLFTQESEKEFLTNSLRRKWIEDWGEREYLKAAFPRRNFHVNPERDYEFVVRNSVRVALPIVQEMERKKNLGERESFQFRAKLFRSVSNVIFDKPGNGARRRAAFKEGFRDAVAWQHRIKMFWGGQIDVVGIMVIAIILALLAWNVAGRIGLLCITLHIFAVALFTYTNVPTERFTHASEILLLIGSFLTCAGFLVPLLSDRKGWGLFQRIQIQTWASRVLVLVLLSIVVPHFANIQLTDALRLKPAYLHGVPITLDVVMRRLGKEKAYVLSRTLRDDPTSGRKMLKYSGLFRNVKQCELLIVRGDICNSLWSDS